jgi:lipid A 3-O-deacylase
VKSLIRIVVCGAIGLFSVPTWAAAAGVNTSPDLLSFSVGQFDTPLISSDNNRKDAVDFRVDYRWGLSLIPATESIGRLSPWIGVEGTTDRGLWGGGGLAFDVTIGSSFYLTPSVGVGAYARGRGKDLGSVVEFRSTLETGYRFESNARAGVYVSHLSNAGIGSHNPGANLIGASFSLPIGRLFGGN